MSKKKRTLPKENIEDAFVGEDILQFVFFYKQLEKLKSNRETYHIEFVLKECYPKLAPFSLIEIESYISEVEIL